ncbi:aminotransferase class I/II-fold pyridoxal phosphate-dependent enzyme [Halorussus salilacus]|uniref:aminotransferase class I/II-fold pyridoxal phosphate-dependent enzyme n=1 Tax=Halorussus salilacus TaxID=2953750 RepID=UPI00209D5832|nr:aminotransferase class I/II-fold pyridoxal phosphate-dependent enzyme [Halorussus salilacus]USZ67468.1 aminotransferase class I/II-fold pyridoxal phosphate-dependent enzyme [Halorussus salilacus]
MDIAEFGLERWFAKYEHEADIMLAESGIRSLDASRFDLDPGKLGYVIPTNGDPEFRAEVGERYGRSADEVLFTCGTQEANFLAFASLMDDDGHAIVVTPTYQALHAVPESFGEVTRVSLEPPSWELDVDAVADAVRPETDVIVLNNPNNPTGRYHPREKVEALYDLAEDADAHLLCDEVYRLLDDDPIPPAASLGERAVSTTSLTKAYGLAGLRFGWLVGSEDVVEEAWNWKDYTTISPGIVGQHVAKQALGDQEDEILSENRDLAKRHRDRVRAFVDDHDLSWYDPVGVNGFVSVPDGFDGSREFCRTVVEEESVVLAPGDLFGYDDYFRIGFGLPTDELEEGLARVSACIERRR